MMLLLAVLAAGRPVLAAPRAGQPAASAPAPADPIERLAPGVQIDWARGVLSAAGSCAADLFAASAEVARVKAERLARLRAEDRLRKALAALGGDKDKSRAERLARLLAPAAAADVARLDVARATVARIDYAATGSVSLRLELPLRPAAPAASAPPAAPNPDAGAPESESPGASE
jgi:hypothetical protein